MVNLASGRDATGERDLPPVHADHLATEIRQIGSAIDPDGARPREQRATRRRAFHIGQQDDDGLFPVGGRLLPDIGVLLLGMIEAHRRSPRFLAAADALDPVYDLPAADLPGADPRTSDQRRHDAFAEIVMAANSTKEAPHLDGAPVTVAVIAQQSDLERDNALDGNPVATMAGSQFPVSRAQFERFIDANGYRMITKSVTGQVVGISSRQRCFTNAQRLSIAARDGYRCARPGCHEPALCAAGASRRAISRRRRDLDRQRHPALLLGPSARRRRSMAISHGGWSSAGARSGDPGVDGTASTQCAGGIVVVCG